MATITLTHVQVNAVLRDYLDEVGDDAYLTLLMKVVRNGKKRKFHKGLAMSRIRAAWPNAHIQGTLPIDSLE